MSHKRDFFNMNSPVCRFITVTCAALYIKPRLGYWTFHRKTRLFPDICLMNWFESRLKKISNRRLVTLQKFCRNNGRNFVNYVATLNYLSRHLVIILVLSAKRPVTVRVSPRPRSPRRDRREASRPRPQPWGRNVKISCGFS